MDTFFSSNIKLLRKRKGYTQDKAALALKMIRSTFSGYENEISQPTTSALLAFSEFYNIAIDTLLKVDLQELTESQIKQLEEGNDMYIKGSKLRILATTVDNENEENIELVPEKAKAGYATGFSDPEYVKELPTFQLPFLSKQKKYRTFQISGDSMLPIPHGSWVTGEFIQDWNTIVNGHGYIIFTLNDGIVFKIAENLIKTDKKLCLFSLNPMYNPFDVPISEVKEVWKFVNYISEEIPEPMIPQDKLLKAVANLKNDMEKMKIQLSRNNDGDDDKKESK